MIRPNSFSDWIIKLSYIHPRVKKPINKKWEAS